MIVLFRSPVRGYHRAPLDLALAEELVRLAGALEGEVLDQHLDLPAGRA